MNYRDFDKEYPDSSLIAVGELPDNMRAEIFISAQQQSGFISEFGIALRDMDSGNIVPESVHRGYKCLSNAKQAIFYLYAKQIGDVSPISINEIYVSSAA